MTTPLQQSLLTTTASLDPAPATSPPRLDVPISNVDTRPLPDQPCFKLASIEPWMPPDAPLVAILNPVMASDLADLIRYRARSGTISNHLRAFGLQLEANLRVLYPDWQSSPALYQEAR